VKRAIKLLERCFLVEVDREKGKSSTYRIADLRDPAAASASLSAIRGLLRGKVKGNRTKGRVTSDPGSGRSRVSSDPGCRVRSDPGVGSLVTHKGSKKDQAKQQAAACMKSVGTEELCRVLKRWGLSTKVFDDPRMVKHASFGLAFSLPDVEQVLTRRPTVVAKSDVPAELPPSGKPELRDSLSCLGHAGTPGIMPSVLPPDYSGRRGLSRAKCRP